MGAESIDGEGELQEDDNETQDWQSALKGRPRTVLGAERSDMARGYCVDLLVKDVPRTAPQ